MDRGPGMVIAHESFRNFGTIAKEFHAVILCGDAVEWCEDWLDDVNLQAQNQAERLISLSETVSHDRVTDKSDRPDFESWTGAQSTVKKIRKKVREILRETVAQQL